MSAPDDFKPGDSVWITRTDSGADESAAAIKAAGYAPLIGPLLNLTAVSTPNASPPDDNAIAFTSPNGVRAFAALTDRRIWPVFAVGDATADMARLAGFETVQNAAGDVNDLAALIIEAKPKAVTHLSGVHIAGDLTAALIEAGIECRREIIYGTRAVEALPDNAAKALDGRNSLAVMLYSPKGAHTLLRLLPDRIRAPLHVISISRNVDAVLESAGARFASRQIAQTPDMPAMSALLETAGAKS